MSELQEFTLVLDRRPPIYHPGEHVRGTLIVTLGESMKMRGITVKCIGECYVHWTVHTNKGNNSYSQEEDYLKEVVQLYGDGKSDCHLGPGHYEYPFEYLLPVTAIPSSYESADGYVRYSVKANIDRPWKLDDSKTAAFTVLAPLDLNREALEFKEPSTITDEKTLSCCCSKYGRVQVETGFNKRCFVPGETVVVNYTITNNCTSHTDSVECSFRQVIVYSTSFGNKKRLVAYEEKLDGAMVGAGKTNVWNNIQFLIPSLPPSHLDGCKYINITYSVVLSVSVECDSLVLDKEIIIGTVPLEGNFSSGSNPPPAVTTQPYAPAIGGAGAYPTYNFTPPS